jgi:hypothetical protein
MYFRQGSLNTKSSKNESTSQIMTSLNRKFTKIHRTQFETL